MHFFFSFKHDILVFKQSYNVVLSFSKGLVQIYELILGLDVLGNPVKVVRGVVEGTYDLFYEPIKVFFIEKQCVNFYKSNRGVCWALKNLLKGWESV